jgi:hypothetical protein
MTSIPFFNGSLPEGIFSFLLGIFQVFSSTCGNFVSWVLQNNAGTFGTVFEVLFGSGFTAFIVYKIAKFFVPFL